MLLASDYAALLGCILLGVLLTLGVRSRRRWLTALSYVICVLIFSAFVIDRKTPWIDYLWLYIWPSPSAVMLQLAIVWGPLIAVLLGLAQYIQRRGDRVAISVIAALVAGWGIYTVIMQLVPPPADMEIRQGRVTLQTSSATCVAAACANYLHTLGYEVSEQQAVRLGLIGPEGGSMTNAWRILRLALPKEYRVHVRHVSHSEMTTSGVWYVVSQRLGFTDGHAECVQLSSEGDTVYVRDSLDGEYMQTWDEFAAGWMRSAVWAEKR